MSRPMHVLCSYSGMPTVRIFSVHMTSAEARERARDSHAWWVMDLVYPEGSRVPVAGDVLDVAKPEGGRLHGSIIAPKDGT